MNVASQLHVGSSCEGTSSTSPIPSPQARRSREREEGGRKTVLIRFLKFCIVGGSGVFVDMGVLFLLADSRTLGLNITISKICAAEIALINNFIWNELWTFRSSVSFKSEIRRRFLFFNAICGCGIGLAAVLLYLFHARLNWNLYFANIITVAVVTLWNFSVNARWNWKKHGERARS